MKNIAINIVTKLVVVFMGLFVSSSMLAQNGNVREETARLVGLNFLRLKDGNPRSDLQLTRVDAVQYPNLYVYNTSENGFIVVASDNHMEPILAYSDEGTFDKDDVAPGANFWFEMYEYAIDSIVRNNVRDVDEKITRRWDDLIGGIKPETTKTSPYPDRYPPNQDGLIQTTWGQGGIYNQKCPWYKTANNETIHALTGCVATALAQVLFYYNVVVPQQTISYAFRHEPGDSNHEEHVFKLIDANGTTNQSVVRNGCDLPARKNYNFGGWDSYSGNNLIAKIMLDCGLAVDMVYFAEPPGSGAHSLPSQSCYNESNALKALRHHFGFPVAQGYLRYNYSFYDWNILLKESICNNSPIIYSGKNDSGGNHTFICDGFINDYFHFNFGNYGHNDGYYLNTNPNGYSWKQDAIFVKPTNITVWNDVITMGGDLHKNWCGGQVDVEQGTSPSANNHTNSNSNKIIYNSPGIYRLRNHCNDNNTTLLWNVKVLPDVHKDVYDEICKKDNYHRVFNSEDLGGINGSAEFNLSRDQTNFDDPVKDFPGYIISPAGKTVGTCTLHLHLRIENDEVMEVTVKDTEFIEIDEICSLEGYASGYGFYHWDADKDGIGDVKCYSSGYYEQVVPDSNGGCETVYSLDLTIKEPDHFDEQTDTTYSDKYIWHYTVANVPMAEMLSRSHYGYEFRHHENINCNDVSILHLYWAKNDCDSDNINCIEDKITQSNRSVPSNMEAIYYGLKHYYEYRDATNDFLFNVFNGISWPSMEERNTFWNLFQSLLDSNTGMMSEEAMQQLIATNPYDYITEEYVEELVERYNRSVMYWDEGYYTYWELPEGYNPDFIEYDIASMNKAYEAYDYAIAHGFSDVKAMYDNAYELLAAEVDNIQSAVCARVTVQFNQKMTMTREAFNGTLQIFNGHESIPMQNILVDFRIEDQQGNDCTNLFQINTLSLDSITGIAGEGSLAAQTNGTALVQFIPTKNAAPTQPVVYSFGGSFSFIDPFTGEGLTYPLYPVEITVNPSPDLYVDYFMQRDILGDDALTEDVVEPSIPAELGVIIHNQGAGIAKNVILETAEPEIIDNEKGLAIDFAMYGASFNGSPRQLGLMEIPFGNIGSGQTAVGEWLFTSSLLGHFVSYEAHVIHNSSYGNSDLSLVSHLDIHELIHPIYAYGNLDDGINDFLVNDNPDAYDTPDSIYFSHGGKTSVGVVDDISFDHLVSPSDTIVTLTVEPSRVGWNYGVTDDPGMNQYNIVSCIRNNDNQDIPLNNVWLTFVTIPDGGDPVYENKLHIVDTIPVQQTTTYTLVFAKKPSNLRIFHGNEDEYWSNAANWEGNIIPQADDEVLINGICQLDEDVEVFSLTVAENQSLTIPEDRILTVSGMLTSASVSRLIIEEGGQLMHGNTGVQATVQKNILPYTEGQSDGWYLIAPPLAGLTPVTSVSNLLNNEYDLYYYDEPTAYWMNQEYAPNGFAELVNGKGYLYANSDEVLLGFAGELQSGSSTVTVLLNYTEGGDLKGFNLVGNPFVYNLTSYASVNVANGCYQLNEAKDDLIVNEIDESNPLKPAEGFFVKATDEGASVTFNPGRGETANRSGSIRVELSDHGKLIDRLIVKMDGEPLEKMSLKEQRTKVFAKQDHQEIAIVPCEGNEQPVNFKAAKNGVYTINVNTNNMEFNYLHLIDNLTGADVDLLAPELVEGPASYTFEAKTTDYASRFRLVFSVCGDADGGDAPFAFINNGDIIIIGAEAGAVLQIVDVLGHVVRSGDAMNRVSTGGMTKGVYVLRLINGDDVKTQKIIID